MSSVNPWPQPQWLAEAPESEQADLHFDYHMRLAAAYACHGCDWQTFAELLGITPNALNLARGRRRVTHDIAIRIEKLLGRDLFPRELFRPEPELPTE